MDLNIKSLQEIFDKNPPVDAMLMQYAQELKGQGWSQERLYSLYIQFLNALSEQEQDSKNADAVRDVIDVICGWCSPNKVMYSSQMKL